MDVTLTTPFTRQCNPQTVTIGGLRVTMTNQNQMSLAPVASVNAVANTVPANAALCPATPIPPAPSPIPSPIPPPPVIVIPQVFQHVPQGIFNGSRNNTPTPVRPASLAITAPSTGQGPRWRPAAAAAEHR